MGFLQIGESSSESGLDSKSYRRFRVHSRLALTHIFSQPALDSCPTLQPRRHRIHREEDVEHEQHDLSMCICFVYIYIHIYILCAYIPIVQYIHK